MNKFAINEQFLQQLEILQALLKNNVSGMFGGSHQSKTFGSSCEFADYRDYQPGDDVSKIDWKAYARFDRLYTKLFLDERQTHTKIYIDASRSMGYDEKKALKALELAASFAYLSICEMDKVSIYFIKNDTIYDVFTNVVGKDQYFDNILKLNDIEFESDSFISDAILPSSVGYGDGFSIIISDFLTDNDYETGIDHLVGKKRDVLCVQILSDEELKPRARGKMHFYDSENISVEYKKNITRDIIAAYNMAVTYVTERLRNFCLARNANYMIVPTNISNQEIFMGKLQEMGVLK